MSRLCLFSLSILLTNVLAMTIPPATTSVTPAIQQPPTAPLDPVTPQTMVPVVVQYGNDTYQACGVYRAGRMLCPADHVCIDNPRPSSCGQACDDHGVCVRRDAALCGTGLGSCAGGGRCRSTIFECIPRDDGHPDKKCASLCFPDYWDGEPDSSFPGRG